MASIYPSGPVSNAQMANGTILRSAQPQMSGTAALLLPVDIKEVISDQISGNEANKLPDGKPYKGDDNNPILMASRSGVKVDIAARVAFPSTFAGKILLGVRKVGGSTVVKSGTAAVAPDKTLLEFDAEEFHASSGSDLSNVYEVVAGYDSNGNGSLEQSEVSVVFLKTPGVDSSAPHDKFRAVTKQFFDNSATTLENDSNYFGTGIAGSLLNAFITGSTPPGATTSTFTLTSTYPGLSHPLGAVWSSSNDAAANLYTFADGSNVSNSVENSNFVHQTLDETLEKQKAEIATYFVQHPSESQHDFPFDYTGSKDFNTTDPGILFSDLGKAFGKVTISGQMTATCSPIDTTDRHKFWVIKIVCSGNFEDLYDYNYYGGANYSAPALQAACVEAGYATLSTPSRPSGRVFKDRVEFQNTVNSWSKIYDASGGQ